MKNPISSEPKEASKIDSEEIKEKRLVHERGYYTDSDSESNEENGEGDTKDSKKDIYEEYVEGEIRSTERIIIRRKENPIEEEDEIRNIEIKSKYSLNADDDPALWMDIKNILYLRRNRVFILIFESHSSCLVKVVSGEPPYEELATILTKNAYNSKFTHFEDHLGRIWICFKNDLYLISSDYKVETYISNAEENQGDYYPFEMFERANGTYILNFGSQIKILDEDLRTEKIIEYPLLPDYFITDMTYVDDDSFLGLKGNLTPKLAKYSFLVQGWSQSRIEESYPNDEYGEIEQTNIKVKDNFVYWLSLYSDTYHRNYRVRKIFLEGMLLLNDVVIKVPDTFADSHLMNKRINFLFGEQLAIYDNYSVYVLSENMKYYKKFKFPNEVIDELQEIFYFMDDTSIAVLCKNNSVQIFKFEKKEEENKDN